MDIIVIKFGFVKIIIKKYVRNIKKDEKPLLLTEKLGMITSI